MAVVGAFVGVYFGMTMESHPDERRILLLALSQIGIFFALVGGNLVANISVHAGYIRALEKQINALRSQDQRPFNQRQCQVVMAALITATGLAFCEICFESKV
jgi:hypothetical protein